MRWETHRAITRAVCSALGIPEGEEIANENVMLDRYPDHEWGYRRPYRIPHHSRGGLTKALNYLEKARRAYLKCDKAYVRYLGRALHYIQDYCVDPRVESWIFQTWSEDAHEGRETRLTHLPVPKDAILAGILSKYTIGEIRDLLTKTEPRRDPREIMFVATFLSALAAKAVVKPNKPKNLEQICRDYRKARKIYLAGLIGTLLFPPLVLAAPIAFYILRKKGYDLTKLKLECEWFHP